MYKWHIKIYLQNGIIEGMYESNTNLSNEVFRELVFVSDIPPESRYFNSIYNLDKTSQILFNVFDVSAVEISIL